MLPPAYSLRHFHPQQGGAALFMALIFLLILTILGVFGMNMSRLENLMAGNTQFQTTALNNAEYVLVRGENQIRDLADAGTGNPFLIIDNTDQYWDAGTIPTTSNVWPFANQKVSIPDVNGDKSDTDGYGIFDDGTGFYVIEDAGLDNSKGECSTYECKISPLPSAIVQVFLVTAQSSSSKGAKRIVQSVVVTDPLPPTPGSFEVTSSDPLE
jgi:Tfp pilus assembly protein PilX